MALDLTKALKPWKWQVHKVCQLRMESFTPSEGTSDRATKTQKNATQCNTRYAVRNEVRTELGGGHGSQFAPSSHGYSDGYAQKGYLDEPPPPEMVWRFFYGSLKRYRPRHRPFGIYQFFPK